MRKPVRNSPATRLALAVMLAVPPTAQAQTLPPDSPLRDSQFFGHMADAFAGMVLPCLAPKPGEKADCSGPARLSPQQKKDIANGAKIMIPFMGALAPPDTGCGDYPVRTPLGTIWKHRRGGNGMPYEC